MKQSLIGLEGWWVYQKLALLAQDKGGGVAKHSLAISTGRRGRFGGRRAEVRMITGKHQVDYGVNLG